MELDEGAGQRKYHLPDPSVTVISLPEKEWDLSHDFLRCKRELLDLAAAVPVEVLTAEFNTSAVMKEWESKVKLASTCVELNNLLLEVARAVAVSHIATWWAPWDGFLTVVDTRCKILDSRGWRCALSAMPGQTLCSRHMKKHFAWGGLSAPETPAGHKMVVGGGVVSGSQFVYQEKVREPSAAKQPAGGVKIAKGM